MLQTILIFSPLLVLFLIGLVIFVLGLRNYRFRIEKHDVDPSERTATMIAFGAMGLSASSSVLLFLLTLSKTILFALCLCGIILSLAGIITLRKLVIAGKEYVYSFSVTIIGMTLLALNFPFLITIHEPFTMIYAFVIITVIGIQIVMVESWKKRRKYENSTSIEEQLWE